MKKFVSLKHLANEKCSRIYCKLCLQAWNINSHDKVSVECEGKLQEVKDSYKVVSNAMTNVSRLLKPGVWICVEGVEWNVIDYATMFTAFDFKIYVKC